MKQGTEFDPRVIRTRGLLRTALMELAVEKSFASLTIQDVTRRAGLNRTTFYLHFNGLHELLEDCARSLFAELRGEIYANLPAGSPPDQGLPRSFPRFRCSSSRGMISTKLHGWWR